MYLNAIALVAGILGAFAGGIYVGWRWNNGKWIQALASLQNQGFISLSAQGEELVTALFEADGKLGKNKESE